MSSRFGKIFTINLRQRVAVTRQVICSLQAFTFLAFTATPDDVIVSCEYEPPPMDTPILVTFAVSRIAELCINGEFLINSPTF